MAKDAENLSFENSIERLERIVEKLENENTPLEEALALFKEGTALSRHCKALLESAQKEIDKALADVPAGGEGEALALEPDDAMDDEIPF